MDYDVIVIGSGAGGAPIAHRFVKAGKTVLILEKGPLLRPQTQSPDQTSPFKRDERCAAGPERILNLPGVTNDGISYFNGLVEPDLNDEPHIYKDHLGLDKATLEGYTAQVVGGGTQVYGGISVRFCEDDFRLKALNHGRTDLAGARTEEVLGEARDWPISYQDLAPYYAEAEELLGINGSSEGQLKPFAAEKSTYQQPLSPSPISQVVADGMDKLGMSRYRTPLAIITEDHPPSGRKAGQAKTGFLNRYGDPLGYKSSTWVALLAPLEHLENFTLRPNCTVTHLEAKDERITKVHYLGPDGTPRSVRGSVVVLACSAIETVRLLLLSGQRDGEFALRANFNDLLGRYFLTHCYGGAELRLKQRFAKAEALGSDWATDHCTEAGFFKSQGLWAGGFIYSNNAEQALPLALLREGKPDFNTIWSEFINKPTGHRSQIKDLFNREFGRRLALSFVANQVPQPTNRIRLHNRIRDKWGRSVAYIDKDWHSHDLIVMNVMAATCRKILEEGAAQHGGYEDLSSGPIQDSARMANHVLGGARFGTRQHNSVLDPTCRMWRFQNLYVTDGSFMPTSGSANPTLTIQANALRVGQIILDEGRV